MYSYKNQKKYKILTTVISILIITFIFCQSLLPGKVSGEESGRIVAFLNNITSLLGLGDLFTQSFVRTCAHFTEFAVLGMSLCSMYHFYFATLRKNIILTMISFTLIAVSDECIQLFSADRAFQISDICIDICGSLCGCLFIVLIIRLNRKSHKTKN